MRRTPFVFACIAGIGQSRRFTDSSAFLKAGSDADVSLKYAHASSASADYRRRRLKPLTAFLLAFNPAANHVDSRRGELQNLHPAPSHMEVRRLQQRYADRAPAVLLSNSEEKPQESVEEVTEKYGLEAGLFSIFKRSGDNKKEGSMQKAGDLLKRYGGAYLLTSTSLAAVSFGLCYLAVNNGVDVGALLSKVGIEVSQTSETAGTVGIAYAIHKAASPIRFPPTVALTPIVAKRVFGRTDDAETVDDSADN